MSTTPRDPATPITPSGAALAYPWLAQMPDPDPDAPPRAFPGQPALLGPVHSAEYARCVARDRARRWPAPPAA